ncbi:GDSL esterase/lipase [Trifolium repens]|nr:GDSL esterase/lipase [Trifolium repens]
MDAYHRKSIAASLVQGVYVLEKDRQEHRTGPNSLAFPWWTSFHFRLIEQLYDGTSIFGAVFEYNPPPSIGNNPYNTGPRYVIAFRGTIKKLASIFRDMKLNLQTAIQGLHRTSRSKIATETVRKMVERVGGNGSNIWLAGHSLGSCIALHAGKTMAKSGIFIESFLFNPPFLSPPINQIINCEGMKHGIRIIGSILTSATVAIAVNLDMQSSDLTSFATMSDWIPSLFVNPSDGICSEYVSYFEHRRKMEEIGAGSIGKIATQNSVVSLMMSAFGKESEPLHLIPSAILIKNLTPRQSFKEDHGIQQWWKLDSHLESKFYKY